MTEAEKWLADQPKMPNGKVDILLVIAESRKRHYCICPKPMRQVINFQGLTCTMCGQPETTASFDFWYRNIPEHISLKCVIYRAYKRDHKPCSGTCDGHGSGQECNLPCECECHATV